MNTEFPPEEMEDASFRDKVKVYATLGVPKFNFFFQILAPPVSNSGFI